MLDLFDELVEGHLAGRDLPAEELFEELCAGEPGDLGGFLLRQAALGVPLAEAAVRISSANSFGDNRRAAKVEGRRS